MVIGLTGQIGAGKTSAARILARLGAAVIDADRIGREVVEQSATLRRQLAKAFGAEIFDRRGQLKRKKLAGMAFADPASNKRLNSLVHPYLLRELRHQTKLASRSHEVVVIDAALLLYWRMDREVDFVLVIHASREARLQRLMARGISRRDALARERAQLPFREFQKRADRLILNNGTRQDLQKKITRLYSRMISRTD